MRLWKRASGMLKDQNSLWLSTLSRKTSFRNPDIESVIIKATSHDEFCFDYEYPERLYKWLRLSDSNIKPIVRGIAHRVDKTRTWVVALKGLMLMHGVFSTKLSVIQRIGRLPFDLSNFKDGHSRLGKTWAHNTFIRAYYAYLDQKSAVLFENFQERKKMMKKDPTVMQELVFLQKVQTLLDLLLQIKPLAHAATVYLIVEAMECIVYEVFDIYSRFCQMATNIMKKIDSSSSKAEAVLILEILQKAMVQGDDLALYMEFCREIGVRNASNFVEIPHVPEDIKYLQSIVNGETTQDENKKPSPQEPSQKKPVEEKSMVLIEQTQPAAGTKMKTIITANWEKFDEDYMMNRVAETNPFLSLTLYTPPHQTQQELPDLITF